MTTWDVNVTANASYHTTVEAESFNEAYRKAKKAWVECDESDIEFNYPNIHVYEQ